MIVTAFNPPTEDLERTFLNAYHAEGLASFGVKNNDGFLTTKAILMGKMGEERAEMLTTGAPSGSNTITTTGNSVFPHNADDPVYLLRFNRVRFYRANSIAGSYSLIATVNLDVDNSEKVTRYDDTTGLSTHFYKISYFNSISSEETELSDPIAATGYTIKTAGKVIDAVARRVADPNYKTLSIDEYIDLMNEVNDDLLTQTHKPYRFLKKTVSIGTTAAQPYLDLTALVPDFWKFDYLVYTYTTGGVPRTYKIDLPLSLEDYTRRYQGVSWADSDELMDIAIDEANNRIYLGPAPKTTQAGVVELHYYKTFNEINSLGDAVETPNTLVYRYKMMAEFYSAKSETDRQWQALAVKYENKYGNEVVKMQRVNRVDTGSKRSFAPKRVPGYRKRYVL